MRLEYEYCPRQNDEVQGIRGFRCVSIPYFGEDYRNPHGGNVVILFSYTRASEEDLEKLIHFSPRAVKHRICRECATGVLLASNIAKQMCEEQQLSLHSCSLRYILNLIKALKCERRRNASNHELSRSITLPEICSIVFFWPRTFLNRRGIQSIARAHFLCMVSQQMRHSCTWTSGRPRKVLLLDSRTVDAPFVPPLSIGRLILLQVDDSLLPFRQSLARSRCRCNFASPQGQRLSCRSSNPQAPEGAGQPHRSRASRRSHAHLRCSPSTTRFLVDGGPQNPKMRRCKQYPEPSNNGVSKRGNLRVTCPQTRICGGVRPLGSSVCRASSCELAATAPCRLGWICGR